jgi:hypothetical protein
MLNPNNNKDVNYRRLNRFFQKFRFDKLVLGKLLMNFLPDGKLVLSIDRTNWKFGKTHINILMLSALDNGVGKPIIWTLLDKEKTKQGNSTYKERIELMEQIA